MNSAGGPLLQQEHHATAAVECFEPSAFQHALPREIRYMKIKLFSTTASKTGGIEMEVT